MLHQPWVAPMATDSKHQYKALQRELALLQQEMMAKKLPVIILVEGWSGSGKGQMIEQIISRLDPRGYEVHSYANPDIGEARRPSLWRFWRDIPGYGNMAILDRSWHRTLLFGSQGGVNSAEAVNIFERQLRDDGYLILKFFLHVGAKEQKKRLEALCDHASTAWRVNEEDWRQNRNYSQLKDRCSAVLTDTNTPWAPWHIVGNDDEEAGCLQVLQTIHDSVKTALSQGLAVVDWGTDTVAETLPIDALSSITHFPVTPEEDYRKALKKERKKIAQLHSELYRRQIPVVIGFEGWDAAGKGGAIRRLSWSLDPRGFRVMPVAAPTKDELNHHYLWRFWKQLPKTGHITIFDRTWYGRVMVEPIEKLTPPHRCEAAYQEINEFEHELHRSGAIVMKFWLHIDQQTQLARFTDRQNTPAKAHKITDEDWRNREKWPQYQAAVDEMLTRTSTPHAPWYVIEGNDKNYARLKVLKIVRKTLETALKG